MNNFSYIQKKTPFCRRFSLLFEWLERSNSFDWRLLCSNHDRDEGGDETKYQADAKDDKDVDRSKVKKGNWECRIKGLLIDEEADNHWGNHRQNEANQGDDRTFRVEDLKDIASPSANSTQDTNILILASDGDRDEVKEKETS